MGAHGHALKTDTGFQTYNQRTGNMRNVWKLTGKGGAFIFFSMGLIPAVTCYYMYKMENAIDFRGVKRTQSLIEEYVPKV